MVYTNVFCSIACFVDGGWQSHVKSIHFPFALLLLTYLWLVTLDEEYERGTLHLTISQSPATYFIEFLFFYKGKSCP